MHLPLDTLGGSSNLAKNGDLWNGQWKSHTANTINEMETSGVSRTCGTYMVEQAPQVNIVKEARVAVNELELIRSLASPVEYATKRTNAPNPTMYERQAQKTRPCWEM